MISLIIPTTNTNSDYTENLVTNIRDLYHNEEDVEIIVEINDKVNLGTNYNNAVAKAKGDKIILLHNDMILKSGFIETMDKHIIKGRITTYTRIEPPIYNDTYPGKVIMDCGLDLKSFDKNKFNEFNLEESLIDGGSQLFFGCYKDDYIKLDDITFTPPAMWSSDDDLHLRYKIAGFEHKVSSAHVYHFVSKTSRANNDYQLAEQQSNIAFMKKWGFRDSQYNKVYKIHYISNNNNPGLSSFLDTFSTSTLEEANIIVEVNTNWFNQQDQSYVMQLSDIIYENGEIGTFELGNLKIQVKSLESFEKDLIYLKNN
jgi:hypothetical protein